MKSRKTKYKNKLIGLSLVMFISICCFFNSSAQTTYSDENIKVELGDLKYVFATNVKDFISELNQVGEQGYKIEQITKLPLKVNEKFDEIKLAGIVSLDKGHKYEYDWFEAFIPGEIVTRINSRAKDGFYFRDRLFVTQGVCEDNSTYSPDKSEIEKLIDNVRGTRQWSVGSIFILERKDGFRKSFDYRVEIGVITSRDRYPEELVKSIEDVTRLGFRPVSMSVSKVANKYAFTVLVERDKLASNKEVDTYRLVSGELGFDKKINALAAEGFSILFAGKTGAVRYALLKSTKASKVELEYQFLKSYKKSFLTDLTNLSNKNYLSYRGLIEEHWICDSVETVLIFQKLVTKENESVKYEMIKIMDELQKPTKQNRKPKFVSPAPEVISKVERLLKDGFVIRDLFFSNGINLLLEKQIK